MSFASFFYADSIYTERYMLTPKQNLKGYEVVLLINYFAGSKIENCVAFTSERQELIHPLMPQDSFVGCSWEPSVLFC